jgi:hypothetical protein
LEERDFGAGSGAVFVDLVENCQVVGFWGVFVLAVLFELAHWVLEMVRK